MKPLRRYPEIIVFASFCAAFSLSNLMVTPLALARTQPDVSLAGESSLVSEHGSRELVTGGAARGNGLFHSFEFLNVEEGRSLYFSSPDGIEQIFSRVTGSSPSNIDGTLGVLGDADLFLLNPNGILFGSNAQLDLSGSFIASAAGGLRFEGFEFSATTPQTIPLLNISAPLGLNLSGHAGSIVNRSRTNGTGLMVDPFQTIALIGGEIVLEGGAITVNDGRIELGGVRNGTLGLSVNGSGWAMDYGAVSEQGRLLLRDLALIQGMSLENNPDSAIRLVADEIHLSDGATIASSTSTDFEGRGTAIELEGDRVELLTGGSLLTRTQAGIGGKITVDATESLQIKTSGNNPLLGEGYSSSIQSDTAPNSPGQGGAIELKTQQLRLEDGGQIFSSTGFFSDGVGGDISLTATESISFQNSIPTEFRTTVQAETRGYGRGGDLRVTTSQLKSDQSYTLGTVSWLDGDGGDVSVEADSIDLNAANAFSSRFSSGIGTFAYGSGDGGDLDIKVQDLRVANSAYLSTAVFLERDSTAELFSRTYEPAFDSLIDQPGAGTGDAGNVNIVAQSIEVFGINPAPDAIPSSLGSVTTGSGNAGDITITTHSLNVRQGGTVGSSTAFSFSLFGEPTLDVSHGDGGDLTINADRIALNGVDAASGLPSVLTTQTLSNGNSGNTTINTRELTVEEGALVVAGTYASGNGRELTINATESILVEGRSEGGEPASIGTFAAESSPAVQQFFFLSKEPSGDTGNLTLETDRLVIRDGGIVSTAHQGSGDAGMLKVNVNELQLEQGGQISATSRSGEGGNVNLQVRDRLTLRQGSQITAEALGNQGNGGNLNVYANTILAVPNENSDIIANAQGGDGGNITITAQGILGIEEREQRNDVTNDIAASSEIGLNGTVKVELLSSDPSQGLAELPITLSNPEHQISTACNRRANSRLVLTGGGGLPADPRQQLARHVVLQDWRRFWLAQEVGGPDSAGLIAPPSDVSLKEAQGFARDRQGRVHLTHIPHSGGYQLPGTTCQMLPRSPIQEAT